jgi:hypothetical protein
LLKEQIMTLGCIDPTVPQKRLQDAFRTLAQGDPTEKQKAILVRQQISSSWQVLAARKNWFAWPSTSAPAGRHRLKTINSPEQGMLSYLGYHVGENKPIETGIRWQILAYIFECHLPPLNGPAYYSQWGSPLTASRLNKMADTLASFTRNAKRRDASFEKAIEDWECDLNFLYEKYYVGTFHFAWPTVDDNNESIRRVNVISLQHLPQTDGSPSIVPPRGSQ